LAFVSTGASSRIAHRVAAADEEGERREETKMKKGKDRAVATISSEPKSADVSLFKTLQTARIKAAEKLDQFDSMLDPNPGDLSTIPTVLLSVGFLMEWYTDGINHELPGSLSSGFNKILQLCATKVAWCAAEHDALLNWSDSPEQQME
jgi:hypothetical protein